MAYKSTKSSTTSQSSTGLNFNYAYDTSQAPSSKNNLNAARVNAFYIINSVHDFAYRYGFTEKAFNFQSNNMGKGGIGNDLVLMSVQDSAGVNNADFATPPEYVISCYMIIPTNLRSDSGQSGTCRMYIWNQATVRSVQIMLLYFAHNMMAAQSRRST